MCTVRLLGQIFFLLFQAIPWSFYEPGSTRFWVHYGLVILGFVLAVITIIAQWVKPAPYGKHESQVKKQQQPYT